MTIDTKTLALIHTALFVSLLPVPGLGQTPSTGDRPILEELVVTAQKREQNLQDVPVGVSLLSGRAMMEAQLKNACDPCLGHANLRQSNDAPSLEISHATTNTNTADR